MSAKRIPLGRPLDWSDSDLDEIALPTQADLERAEVLADETSKVAVGELFRAEIDDAG